MNKQQLASKIWASANKMRSKIEANEYKDYILGFIFYKFLSDKEEIFLKKSDWTEEDLPDLKEEDEEMVDFCQKQLGYFISYDNLFSTWLKKGRDFDVSNVRDAISAFNRLINETHKRVFAEIFDTLQTGLSKLGDSAGSQTKAISELIQLIKDIPTDGSQDYDVLGFIYEYLISNFAANAGKKAGEFYTPHEVSVLMSEIIANHLNHKDKIEIYDPTSGSGSLLINIGHSVAKHINDKNNIKYYAQELKENTYNLTRMNLVMRDILPDNIVARNGDTLEDDWPYFDETDKERTYKPLYVDAVVSNPPYSQNWDPSNKEADPRYSRFGLAPKGKADYAFLLHDLYHVKPDGIMTIVLPHGVLFRGGEEEKIRKNLVEYNNIDAIIGLPANIFFGTGIPTIIMVLRQQRKETDVLIVDASKGFAKEGKNNKLRACDIKKIADAVIGRSDIDKFSRNVSRQEIRDNGYNLNIPRYVDSSGDVESWDIYASMFGGIPNSEIDSLAHYWDAFPTLRAQIFGSDDTPYSTLSAENVKQTIAENEDVKRFVASFNSAFMTLPSYLKGELLDGMQTLKVAQEEKHISDDIFKRLVSIPLVDKYQAYQLLDNEWTKTAIDLEIIQTEGFEATRKVDPNMVIKKKDGKDEEVQNGWMGRVIPFELVQQTLLRSQYDELRQTEAKQEHIGLQLTEIIENMTEEEKDGSYLNDNNDAFVAAEVKKYVANIFQDIQTDEICCLNTYLTLTHKADKLDFIAANKLVCWDKIEGSNKDGTFGKTAINRYISLRKKDYRFPEDSLESKIVLASDFIVQEGELKKMIKEQAAALHALTKTTIEGLSDDDVMMLLELKWITPLCDSLAELPGGIIDDLVARTGALAGKYSVTYMDLDREIREAGQSLSGLIDELDGNDFDMGGLREFQKLLRPDRDEEQ